VTISFSRRTLLPGVSLYVTDLTTAKNYSTLPLWETVLLFLFPFEWEGMKEKKNCLHAKRYVMYENTLYCTVLYCIVLYCI